MRLSPNLNESKFDAEKILRHKNINACYLSTNLPTYRVDYFLSNCYSFATFARGITGYEMKKEG
jgi:hypothetical protein